MKKKILTLIAIMLCFASLTACGESNENSSSNAAQNKETSTADSMETPTAETIEQSETKDSDDFVSMAKELFFQYHDDENEFNSMVDKISQIYESVEGSLWIGDSSYSYIFGSNNNGETLDITDFSDRIDKNSSDNYKYIRTNCYSISRNSETLKSFANNLSMSNNATSDVTFKTVNSFDMAHFTFETKEEFTDYYYFNECYIANDEKDDEFLVLTYRYINRKKTNDNQPNPAQVNGDHYDAFLASALSAQTITENKMVEAELITDVRFEETYSGVAVIVPELHTRTYTKNVPIEGTDDYDVIDICKLNNNSTDLADHFYPHMSISYSVSKTEEGAKLVQIDFNNSDSIYKTEEISEINVNGLNGYMFKYNRGEQYNEYCDRYDYIYSLSGPDCHIEISFITDEEFISFNQIQAIINSLHFIEKS